MLYCKLTGCYLKSFSVFCVFFFLDRGLIKAADNKTDQFYSILPTMKKNIMLSWFHFFPKLIITATNICVDTVAKRKQNNIPALKYSTTRKPRINFLLRSKTARRQISFKSHVYKPLKYKKTISLTQYSFNLNVYIMHWLIEPLIDIQLFQSFLRKVTTVTTEPN